MDYSIITPEEVGAWIVPRKSDSHKGNFGHALLIAGHRGRMGAAVLAARACLRSGVGLLTVMTNAEEKDILQIAIPEAMLLLTGLPTATGLKTYAAVGIGPGIGTGKKATMLLKAILKKYKPPLLIDADALNILSADKELLQKIPAGSILTPHPKEFDRLFGEHKTHELRMEKALSLSLEHPWTIVLKNHQTLIASRGKGWLNTTGNAGLAKGGSGDVLSGMITAFLAQGYTPQTAAIIAVYLHGSAADIAVADQSVESLLATDVIEHIGKAFNRLR